MRFNVGDKVKLSDSDGDGFLDMIIDQNPHLEKMYMKDELDFDNKIFSPDTYNQQIGLIAKAEMDRKEEWYYVDIPYFFGFGTVRVLCIMMPDDGDPEGCAEMWTTKLEKVA